MSDPLQSRFLDDPQFQSLLVACLELLERGATIDREALARDFPEYASEIGQFLEDRQLLSEAASKWSHVEPSRQVLSSYEKTMATPSASGGTPSAKRAARSASDDYSAGDRIRYIGEYEILEEIARGGMGIVYKARQQKLKRLVALKMILGGRLAEDAEVERFRREAQAAARLNHPHIVPVHEIGEHEGRHYFTMDFVEGCSLAEKISEETLAPRVAAGLVRTLAETIEFAHQEGAVHRDLKPANVLLTPADEPRITDFGLVKMLEAVEEETGAELTASGQVLGTPSYMSPEQAAGKQQLVGPATDIYSLGAVLYACLTGRAPFVADSPVETLLQVLRKEPVSPRTLNPSVPRDLETICLKCLAKEPHKRYGTAGLLAEDLQRFLDGRPVLARPVGAVSRAWRWSRRNPAIAASLAFGFLSLLSGLLVATRYAVLAGKRADSEAAARKEAIETADLYRAASQEARSALARERVALAEAEAQRDEARKQKSEAERQGRIAQERLQARTRTLYALQLTRAQDLWKSAPAEAGELLKDESACPPEMRDFSWRHLTALTSRQMERWREDSAPINTLAVSADRNLIAAGGVGKTVRVYRVGQERPVAVLDDHPGWVKALSFSPDARLLASASEKVVTLWKLEDGTVLRKLHDDGEIRCLDFTQDGEKLVTGGPGVTVWNVASGERDQQLGDPSRSVRHLVVPANSRQLLTANDEGQVVLWQLGNPTPIRTVAEVEGRIASLDVSTDKSRYLVAYQQTLSVRELDSDREVCRIQLPAGSVRFHWGDARFSPDSRLIVAAPSVTPVKLWDAETGEELLTLAPDLGTVGALHYARDGRSVLTGDQSGAITRWRVPPVRASRSLDQRGFRLAFSSDGERVASTDQTKVVVFNPSSGTVVWSQPIGGAFRLHFSPRGDRVAGLVEGGQIRVWDAATGDELARKENRTSGEALTFVDNRRLAFSSGRSGIQLWDPDSNETSELEGGGRSVLCLDASPDSRLLAAGHGIHPLPDGTPPGKVVLWNLETLERVADLQGHKQFGVYDVDFSPDGQNLVSVGGGAIVWDCQTLQPEASMSAHGAAVMSVAYAPDGKSIATGSLDSTVRVWDPGSGEQRLMLTGHGNPMWITSVNFSPAEGYLLSASFDMSIRLWPADVSQFWPTTDLTRNARSDVPGLDASR